MDGGEDLAAHYEAMRGLAVGEGLQRAGLGAALLVSQGMAAWMRGWRACTPAPCPARAPGRSASPGEIVGVLTQMALALA